MRVRTIAAASIVVAMAATIIATVLGSREGVTAGEETQRSGVVAAALPRATGPSGLPIPRFVSLKTDRVNVRRGPSTEHQVAWVFSRRGLPVEIIAEFEHWRRVRDNDGEEGWVYYSLLAGRRTVMVAPWQEGAVVPLRAEASQGGREVARLETGVVGDVRRCTGEWCQITVSGYAGWIPQTALWGVYPGERVD